MLLNRASLDAARFASKGDLNGPVLSSLCITPTHCVATDSFHLLEVSHCEQDNQLKPDGIRNDSATGLLPAEAAIHASKNIPSPKEDTLFAIRHAFSSADPEGKKMTLTTTDLMQEKSVEAHLIDGKYPDYNLVFPKSDPLGQVRVSAKYLRDIADYFAKHAEGGQILIEFNGVFQPLVFRGETDKGTNQQVRGLIMPLRNPDRP